MTPEDWLKFAADCPYDSNENGDTKEAPDWAHAAARGVLRELNGRRGIKNGLNDVEDEEIREEIVLQLAAIIRAAPAWFNQRG